MDISGLLSLTYMLAYLEIKNPQNKQLNNMFTSLSKTRIAVVGAISGFLVPLAICLPALLYLGAGFLYTIMAETLIPGITGFQGEPFTNIFTQNLSFFSQILVLILKYTALPSILMGLCDITLRHRFFNNPQNNVWPWLYKHCAAPISAFFIIISILTWSSRKAMFGIAGLLVINSLPAAFLGLLYRGILLATLDKQLLIITKFKNLRSS